MKPILLILLCSLIMGCTSVQNAEQLQLGKQNFSGGDYPSAFRQLMPSAINGNAQAEYAVGYMYYYGLGVTQDIETGTDWMKKSATQHNSSAIKAMRLLK
jgi:TPR repeat protein